MAEGTFTEEVSSKQIDTENLKDNDKLWQMRNKQKMQLHKSETENLRTEARFAWHQTSQAHSPHFPPSVNVQGVLQNCTVRNTETGKAAWLTAGVSAGCPLDWWHPAGAQPQGSVPQPCWDTPETWGGSKVTQGPQAAAKERCFIAKNTLL